MSDLLLDTVSLIFGLLFILVAVFAGSRMPTGKLKYTSEKRSLELDPVPLLLLMGLAMAGTSAYFRYKANDALPKELETERTRNNNLEADLARLKGEQLRAILTLTELEDPALLKSVDVTEASPNRQYTSPVQFTHKDGNSFWAQVRGLELGSNVTFQAEDKNGTMWTGSLKEPVATAVVDMQVKPKKTEKK
jgi:hypothetical protein